MSPDAPSVLEPEVEEAYDRLIEQGQIRLARPFLSLVSTGLLEASMSVQVYWPTSSSTRHG